MFNCIIVLHSITSHHVKHTYVRTSVINLFNLPTSDPPLRSVIHCPEVQNISLSLLVNLQKMFLFRKSSSDNYVHKYHHSHESVFCVQFPPLLFLQNNITTSISLAAPSVMARGQVYNPDDGPNKYSLAI